MGRRDDRQLWTVDAPVLEWPGRPPMACAGLRTSRPPQGGNVVVRGLDPRTVPGAETFPNGTVLTPRLRLAGALDNGDLVLTEPPSPAPPLPTRTGAAALAACDLGDAAALDAAELLAIRERVHHDPYLAAHHIKIISTSAYGGLARVMVTAATAEQIQHLQDRNGPHLVITSWLRQQRASPQ
jgi:hypothetical protein